MIAACGLALIGMQGGHAMTFAGFMFTLAAAAMWALGNVATKRMGPVDLVSALVVWASLIPPLPFLGLSRFRLREGARATHRRVTVDSMLSVFAVAYLAFVATLVGYSLTGQAPCALSASQVTPFSLLVPIIGLVSAALLAGRPHADADRRRALVMARLMVNVFGGWIVTRGSRGALRAQRSRPPASETAEKPLRIIRLFTSGGFITKYRLMPFMIALASCRDRRRPSGATPLPGC